ncbi:aldo/keto reductase [Pyrolobus fumarii 1A]|uniref:Aldo/keto reductase n=1 Tax=Pyrolobus fumarii (strain DSM 11204 / 1A) TaxID=694429 RepID=G0EFF8_PYRF1|nr:aldo/keto reductase [Pyrolobus fumarii]AEM38982.1 aldo/keto reductase [Pyrolobus fumarii 1A]
MRYTTLGDTGLRVSLIAYGVYGLHSGPYQGLSKRDLVGLIREARRLGINFFETADVYDRGEAERILGEALGDEREEVIIATKIGYDFYGSPERPRKRFDPEYLVTAAERSCERIGKCPIDLIYMHNPPLEVLREPAIYEAMDTLREENLAKHLGVSLDPSDPELLASAREAMKRRQTEVVEFAYSMLEQEPGRTIAYEAEAAGKGIVVMLPFAGGILDESLSSFEEGEAREWEEWYAGGKRKRGWYRWAFATYQFMKNVLQAEFAEVLEQSTPAQIAIRFILSTIPVHSIVVAARTREKLREAVEAVEQPRLPQALVEKLRVAYGAGPCTRT